MISLSLRHLRNRQVSRRRKSLRAIRPWHGSIECLEARQVLDALSLADFYTEGRGSGLNFQGLEGFAVATTYGTTIAGGTAFSALEGVPPEHPTGESPIREGFQFNPAFVFNDPSGNLIGWDTQAGGTAPWLVRPELVGQQGAVQDLGYPIRNYSDSAATATALFTGVKTYRGAIGVDIFEQPATNLLEVAQRLGKSTGAVSSVPLSHATPAAAMSHHNTRGHRDADFPDLDNTLQQALRETKPTVVMGGGHPIIGHYGYVRPSTLAALRDPADGLYDEWTFLERGPDAADRLAAVAAQIDPEADQHLVAIFGARGQSGNLPWVSADGEFSRAGTTGRRDTSRPLEPGETVEEFLVRERNENPRLYQMTEAALDVLEDDPDGFWLMVEGGDIDWAMHDNNIDATVGAIGELDRAVESVIDWIGDHGGFDENLLIVTADHDHYLTLTNNYPELVASDGLPQMTPGGSGSESGAPEDNGYFWGPDPSRQFGWSSHSLIPVPVHYQGPTAVMHQLEQSVGQGFVAYDHPVAGIEGMIDQVHLYEAMSTAVSEGLVKNVIIMIGDGMGWEATRAAAIAGQVQPAPTVQARLDPAGLLVIRGTNQDDTVQAIKDDRRVVVNSDGEPVPIQVNGRLVDQIASWLVTDVRFFGWQGDDQLLKEGTWTAGPPRFKAGDANMDQRFDQRDIVQVLQAGVYLTGEPAAWEAGDWNGDGIFDQLDIVAALQAADYLA